MDVCLAGVDLLESPVFKSVPERRPAVISLCHLCDFTTKKKGGEAGGGDSKCFIPVTGHMI